MTRREALLRERLERGDVKAKHLGVAAWLGDAAATAVAGKRWVSGEVESWSWPARHAMAHARLDRKAIVRASALMAARVLDLVEDDRPDDDSSRRSIEAALVWVDKPTRKNRLTASRACAEALALSNELHSSGHTRTDAAFAAEAAASAAMAAAGEDEDRNEDDEEGSALYAGYAMSLSKDEYEIQRRLLISVLCGDELPGLPPRGKRVEDAVRERVNVLRHRLRMGVVSSERLRVAAWLGDKEALTVAKGSWHGGDSALAGMSGGTRRLMIEALCGDEQNDESPATAGLSRTSP